MLSLQCWGGALDGEIKVALTPCFVWRDPDSERNDSLYEAQPHPLRPQRKRGLMVWRCVSQRVRAR